MVLFVGAKCDRVCSLLIHYMFSSNTLATPSPCHLTAYNNQEGKSSKVSLIAVGPTFPYAARRFRFQGSYELYAWDLNFLFLNIINDSCWSAIIPHLLD